MGVRKVIQDSDDESVAGASPPPTDGDALELSLSPIIDLQYSSPARIMDLFRNTSNEFTEPLSCQSDNADDDSRGHGLNDRPSETVTRSCSQQHDTSPNASQDANRRATTGHSERKERKPLKTYGSKGSQETGHSYSRSDDEDVFSPGKENVGKSSMGEMHQQSPRPRDDGISGGDPTASRVEAMLNNYHGADDLLNGNLTLGSFPSIHTSVQNSMTPKTPKAVDSQVPQKSQQSTIPTVADTTSSTSTAGHTAGSAGRITGETMPDATLSSHTREEVNDTAPKRSRKRSRAGLEMEDDEEHDFGKPGASQTSTRSNARENSTDIFDELAITGSKSSSTTERNASKTSKKAEVSSVNQSDELGADEMALGLPKEQYQPRPSRSRSGRNDEELLVPENFSKRPEVLAKKKANKRRKTTALARPSPKVEVDVDDEDEDPTLAPARKPDKAKIEPVVLITAAKDEPQKVDNDQADEADALAEADHIVQEEEPAHDKAPPSSPPKKKRGRPKKQNTEQATTDLSTTDRPEADHDEDLPNLESLTKTAPKKAGRKKRKTDEPPPAVLDDHGDSDDNAAATLSEDDGQLDPHLSHTEGNRQPAATSTTSTARKGAEDPAKPNTPPQTPQKAASKGPDKHSPLNSSKIKYRVGLSKRQRIQPLLKIVKK